MLRSMYEVLRTSCPSRPTLRAPLAQPKHAVHRHTYIHTALYDGYASPFLWSGFWGQAQHSTWPHEKRPGNAGHPDWTIVTSQPSDEVWTLSI